jgi:hypothetical protein
MPNTCRALPDEARSGEELLEIKKPAIAKALAGEVDLAVQFSNHFQSYLSNLTD